MRNMKTDTGSSASASSTTNNKITLREKPTARILFINSSINNSYAGPDTDLNNYLTNINDMEASTSHITVIDDEDEKDPLALDTSSTEDSLGSAPSTSKHSHSLR